MKSKDQSTLTNLRGQIIRLRREKKELKEDNASLRTVIIINERTGELKEKRLKEKWDSLLIYEKKVNDLIKAKKSKYTIKDCIKRLLNNGIQQS